jgi:hypothetical protein
LRTHGFSLTQYRRAYYAPHAPRRASRATAGLAGDGTLALSSEILERVAGDQHLLARLADEVAEAIFSGPTLERLRISLFMLITQRMELVAKSAADFERCRAELTQAWRLQQGGPDGGPTSTKDLAEIAKLLSKEVHQGEELLVKTVRLALEEARLRGPASGLDAGLSTRYTGSAEVLQVPADCSAAERETIRTLFGMVVRDGADAAPAVIDVTPTAPVEAAVSATQPHSAPSGLAGGLPVALEGVADTGPLSASPQASAEDF